MSWRSSSWLSRTTKRCRLLGGSVAHSGMLSRFRGGGGRPGRAPCTFLSRTTSGHPKFLSHLDQRE